MSKHSKGASMKSNQTVTKADVGKLSATGVVANSGPSTPPPPPTMKILKVVKKDAKYRGAREAWYQELIKHDGKPVDEYLAATKSKPPSLPKSGQAENPTGWVSFFVRTNVVQIESRPAA
jgi:hypothetical protein